MSIPVVVAGSLAQRIGRGGHAWVFLQYLLGLRRLECDAMFVDWVDSDMVGGPVSNSAAVSELAQIMGEFGLADAWMLLDRSTGTSVAGCRREDVIARLRGGLLINVMGYLDDEELLAAAGRRVFLDIDPGFSQMWCELGLVDLFTGHDAFVTIGENVGTPGCTIPTCGLRWITTRQPVVISEWPVQATSGDRFTSVGAWRGPFAPIEYRGRTYGLRVHEFRRFIDLPRLTGRPFELVLEIHPGDETDLNVLHEQGWSIVKPDITSDPRSYRRYVQASKAEFMVAKNMYVETRSGWFSDRSTCYLASGKPVLAQDTGIRGLYPIGEGLLSFASVDEAVAGVENICGNYQRHCRAAREIAEEYFDSRKVLMHLLEKLDVA